MTAIHGHRGCRGLLPENTVAGFVKAVELGATALEMDLVISADGQVVVSHEPWMNHKICLAPDGSRIPEAAEKSHNLHRMPYARIRQYDCGSLANPDFPEQTPLPAHKPLLSEVVQAIEGLAFSGHKPQQLYNLEVKSSPAEYGIFQPRPEEFARLVLDELSRLQLPFGRVLVQSFDSCVLEEFYRIAPQLALGFLVENEQPLPCLRQLSFTPRCLNPDHALVTQQVVDYCHSLGIQVIPWTVNEKADMHRLLDLGAHGLITDYPNRAAAVLQEREQAGSLPRKTGK